MPVWSSCQLSMDIIFDIGNVICAWNPQKIVGDLFSDPAEQAQAMACVFKHEDWLTLDKGLIELEEAIENAQKRCRLDPEKIKSLYLNTPPSLIPTSSVTRAIAKLSRSGFRLFVLSNMQKHAWEYLKQNYGFWSYFKGIVVSFEIQQIKPDPEIFKHIIEKYEIIPAQAIFLDDLKNNILSAQTFGIKTIHVGNIEEAIAELYDQLGII